MNILLTSTPLELNRKELIQFQLKWILNSIKINETELMALSYVYLYGNDAPAYLVKDKVSTNEKSIENIISKFRKKGIIIGVREQTKLNPGIKLYQEDLTCTIKLKLND